MLDVINITARIQWILPPGGGRVLQSATRGQSLLMNPSNDAIWKLLVKCRISTKLILGEAKQH